MWQEISFSLMVFNNPKVFFRQVLNRSDQHLGLALLFLTSFLFMMTSLLAFLRDHPFTTPPLWNDPRYRLIQMVLLPAILGTGWWASATLLSALSGWIAHPMPQATAKRITAPSLFIPLWFLQWPIDLADTLGFLDILEGFWRFWFDDFFPLLILGWMGVLLTLGIAESQMRLLRESFALAVLALLPALCIWAVFLR